MDAAVSEGLSVARLVSRLVSLGMCRGSSATNLVHRSYLPLETRRLFHKRNKTVAAGNFVRFHGGIERFLEGDGDGCRRIARTGVLIYAPRLEKSDNLTECRGR